MINKYLYLLIIVGFFACKQVPPSFTFVQLCDTQLGMGGYEHDKASFEQAVKQINALDPAFVVVCGDLVNDASDSSFSDFNSIREGFRMPCYLASGNHDVGNLPTAQSLIYYREKIGDDYYQFEYSDVAFLVTNTQLWKAEVPEESQRHHDWFMESLKANKNKFQSQVVIGHYPLYIDSISEEEAYFNLPSDKRFSLVEAFEQNHVRAYLSGHTHHRMINQYNSIWMVGGDPTSKVFDENPLGFRVWTVSADTLLHDFVALEGFEFSTEK
ncbi:metallophosphoesterase [Reichenbachiella ulvae]|uniref:Metallophosphoesterase n=1 Tax=Reichenbachiella ulvae TaxID=2980104 RepID=A0ABT3CP95_9BACT|nr:metallophosphoesterase [Reichenbachiella ulvae]MCV9385275.1 metallophosphoesterase [Reichenbachiella ulvae]